MNAKKNSTEIIYIERDFLWQKYIGLIGWPKVLSNLLLKETLVIMSWTHSGQFLPGIIMF